jgi:hypothetical protein
MKAASVKFPNQADFTRLLSPAKNLKRVEREPVVGIPLRACARRPWQRTAYRQAPAARCTEFSLYPVGDDIAVSAATANRTANPLMPGRVFDF